MFSWEEITGNNRERLIDFLKQDYNVDWIKASKIKTTKSGKKIIMITENGKSFSLSLNTKNTKVNLEIDNNKTDQFIVKNEDEKLNIYKKKNLDLRILFLSPYAPKNIIRTAHADSDSFIDRLKDSIKRAKKSCKYNNQEFKKICKYYHKERCIATIIMDDAVLYRRIKTDQYGKAERLTDTSFNIVSSDSVIGKDLVHLFEKIWNNEK